MAKQSQRLAVLGQGILHDDPPTAIQPPLPDGVHLRWAFRREDGFPWFGFFLLRRDARKVEPRCLAHSWQMEERDGNASGFVLPLIVGQVASNEPLRFTDDFPPAGQRELDLRSLPGQARTFFAYTLPADIWAIAVTLTLGFRDERAIVEGRRASMQAVRVTASLRGVPVEERIVSGVPGAVVSVALATDALDALRITPVSGAAVLPDAAVIDLCLTLADADSLREGWRPVPHCPQPLALPVTHPDYPASGGAAVNAAAAEATALGRIVYGPPAAFGGAAFADLHAHLLRLVKGGPVGPPMVDTARATTYPGIPDIPEPGVTDPTLPAMHPLDLTLLASLHPAVAQALGLYWLDRTAVPGVAYDYLLISDATGTSGGNPVTAMAAWLVDAPGIAGYVCFNRRVAPASPLVPPTDVRAYLLPGVSDIGGVGLRWPVSKAGGHLLPQAPVLYHLWRAALGDSDTPGASGMSDLHLTDKGPTLVVDRVGGSFSPTQWPADWPQQFLYHIDRPADEGWYGYTAGGMDLFGRISAPSDPAAWWQWGPMPNPRPWYYTDPPTDRVVHATAVRLLDTTPPPPPAGVEATLLDPQDPFVVQDARYAAWRAAHPGITGLRVSWRWREAQMRQASDTREFRVYYHPGTDPPFGAVAPTAWQTRCHVTGFNDDVVLGAGGAERVYTIMLPVAGAAAGAVFAAGVPLAPSLADPVVYANVTVTAADGAAHTADAPQWSAGAWGNRPGNESATAAPTKVYRVRRDPPPPPPVPPDSERVYATPADYHARSYWTVRLSPAAHLGTHVFRALDVSLFAADWTRRPRPPLGPDTSGVFPDPGVEPRWDVLKRQQVANELNGLNAFPHTDAGRASAFAAYAALSNDGLRVLAGLEGVAPAFTQLTPKPLPEGTADYRDTLDGRATNRYFYRTAYVDGAGNRSALSLSGPPIYLPNVVPPRPPVLTSVTGGERRISLAWASNREADLTAYRVYRGDTPVAARDARSMTLVHTENVAPGAPEARPASVVWADDPAPALVTRYYAVTSVDDAGNESDLSAVAAARAYDDSLPVPPIPTVAWVERAGGRRAEVTWTSDDEVMVQRREGGNWIDLAQWRLPGTVTVRDPFSDPTQSYAYRLRVRKATGALALGAAVTLAANP